MNVRREIIPAAGTVRFTAYHFEGERLETRHGGKDGAWGRQSATVEWRRPCVGLVLEPGFGDRTDEGSLIAAELIVSEHGSVQLVHEYLHDILGEAHWDHTAHCYEPHVSSPVIDAPLMRVVDESTDPDEPTDCVDHTSGARSGVTEHIKPTYKLRRELLRLYLDQGIAGVRDHLGELCPGCVTDLIVGYVIGDAQRAVEAEFGTN